MQSRLLAAVDGSVLGQDIIGLGTSPDGCMSAVTGLDFRSSIDFDFVVALHLC